MTAYLDLLPELLEAAGKASARSPHEIARNFVLEQGQRLGSEIVVVLDKQDRFLAAGTQDLLDRVGFPPTITAVCKTLPPS